jgi:heme-degrading monooxygenase HmoA
MLHRSLGPDAEFRFVDVSPFRSARAWRAAYTHPDFPRRARAFPAHPCLYEIARDDGAQDAAEHSVVIDAVELDAADDLAFLAAWDAARGALRGRPGHRGTRLHRSLMAETDFRFVEVSWWDDPAAFDAAALEPVLAAGRSHRALYEVIRRC